MRICFILGDKDSLGGIQNHVCSLLNELSRNKSNDYHIISNRVLVPYIPKNVKVHVLDLNSRRNPFSTIKLFLRIKEINPSLIHIHGRKFLKLIRFYRLFIKFKLVLTLHNTKGIQKLNSLSKSFFVKTAIDHFIVVSDPEKIASRVINATLIHNGIKMPVIEGDRFFYNSPPFENEGLPVLIACGRFVREKGFDILLDALSRVHNAKLWLVGDGPEMPSIRKIVTANNMDDRVWLPGRLSHDDVLQLISKADLFVISSLSEGGPITMCEAMFLDCPVVSTKVGFAPEFLDEQHMFSDISAESIQLKLNEIILNLEPYNTTLMPNFEKVKNSLGITTMAKKTEAVYQSLS